MSYFHSYPPTHFTLEWFPLAYTSSSHIVTGQCWAPDVPKPPVDLLLVWLLHIEALSVSFVQAGI